MPHTFLNEALKPLKPYLNDPGIIEICVNRPQQVFIERAGVSGMEYFFLEDLSEKRIQQIGERVAQTTSQSVNAATPLLSTELPTGERIQVVLPPAAPEGGSLTIRKQVVRNLRLEDYKVSGALKNITVSQSGLSALEEDLVTLLKDNTEDSIEKFLGKAAQNRVSMVISGGTGSGKTTFLNMLLNEIAETERLITIEDTKELNPPQKNTVSLLYSRNDQGMAKVDAEQLVAASLRMRPDRILIGELRGTETLSFLEAINTGHPGSLTTVHANSPNEAYHRLANLILKSSNGLTKQDILDDLKRSIPLVIQIGHEGVQRGRIKEIFYAPAFTTGE